MSHSIFGWDLPPGCRLSDIPGNRPEDEAWEAIYDKFWDKERLTKTHTGIRISEEKYALMDKLYNSKNYKLSDMIDDYISNAIEYGMEIGEEERKATREENKYCDRMAVDKAFEDSKTIEEAQEKVLEYLGLKPKENRQNGG